jgi:hypothetical protein
VVQQLKWLVELAEVLADAAADVAADIADRTELEAQIEIRQPRELKVLLMAVRY